MTLEKLKAFFKLIRWFHELVAILPFVGLYFVIDYYAKRNHSNCNLSGFNFFILCICVQLLIAAGCIHNDIMDRDIDKINKPKTHVVEQSISLKNSWSLFGAFTVLIILFSIYISAVMFKEWTYICAIVYSLSLLYNSHLKRSPLFGNILMALLAGFIPLVILFFAKECIAVINNKNITLLIYLYAAFPFLIIIPRELSLDISDMEGDLAGGCRTLPIVIGAKKAKRVVYAFLFLIIILSLFVMLYYSHLRITFALVDLLLFFYMYKLRLIQTRLDYIRIGRFLWFIMIAGLVGFTLATLLK